MKEETLQLEFEQRLFRIQTAMVDKGIDFLFIPASVNMRYVTGLPVKKTERITAALIPREGNPAVVCPSFEVEKLEKLAKLPQIEFLGWHEDADPYMLVKTWLQRYSIRSGCKIGVEPHSWFVEYARLARVIPHAAFYDAADIFFSLRMVKTDYEINCIKLAIKIIEAVRDSLFDDLRPGMQQAEARALLCYKAMREGGLDPVWWGVYFGKNTSSPHGGDDEVLLEEGMVVMVDSGVEYQGYRSDVTRTKCFGKASKEFKEIFHIVYDAQRKAIDAIKPGVPAEHIDSVARDVINRAGYGKYFLHRLGHGIGMEEHEPPWIAPGERTELREGMVFTVEPGIYLPGRFGIRLEDIVVVTENGCRVLSNLLQDPSAVEFGLLGNG